MFAAAVVFGVWFVVAWDDGVCLYDPANAARRGSFSFTSLKASPSIGLKRWLRTLDATQ